MFFFRDFQKICFDALTSFCQVTAAETTVGTQTAPETMALNTMPQPTSTVAEFQSEGMSQEVTAAAATTEPAQPQQGEQTSETTTVAETTVADSAPQQVTEPPGGRDAEIQTTTTAGTTKADTEARNSTGGQQDSPTSSNPNNNEPPGDDITPPLTTATPRQPVCNFFISNSLPLCYIQLIIITPTLTLSQNTRWLKNAPLDKTQFLDSRWRTIYGKFSIHRGKINQQTTTVRENLPKIFSLFQKLQLLQYSAAAGLILTLIQATGGRGGEKTTPSAVSAENHTVSNGMRQLFL